MGPTKDTDQNNIPPQIQELQMQFETWDKVITQVTSTPATPKQLQKTKTIMTELNSTVNAIKNAQRSTENKKNDINFDILNKSLLTKKKKKKKKKKKNSSALIPLL